MRVLEAERERYTELMSSVPAYAHFSPGEHYVDKFIEMSGCVPSKESPLKAAPGMPPNIIHTTVIDAGCATGQGAVELAKRGFAVTMLDITNAGLVEEAQSLPFAECSLWHELTRQSVTHYAGLNGSRDAQGVRREVLQADYVFCCDVMEHIPPQFTMLCIQRMLDASRKGVFLSIALQPDNFGVWVNKPLHQTVQLFPWWRDQLREVSNVVALADLIKVGLYYIEKPKT